MSLYLSYVVGDNMDIETVLSDQIAKQNGTEVDGELLVDDVPSVVTMLRQTENRGSRKPFSRSG